MHTSMHMSMHMPMHMSIHMSMHMPMHMSIHMSMHMSIHMSLHMPMHTTVHRFVQTSNLSGVAARMWHEGQLPPSVSHAVQHPSVYRVTETPYESVMLVMLNFYIGRSRGPLFRSMADGECRRLDRDREGSIGKVSARRVFRHVQMSAQDVGPPLSALLRDGSRGAANQKRRSPSYAFGFRYGP